jgi:membrane-associated protein
MDAKRLIKTIAWGFSIVVVVLLVWSLLNYKVLENSVTGFIQVWGLIALVLIVVILEGAPIFVGGGIAAGASLAMGANPWLVLTLFIISAIIGNVLYYYLGYFSGRKVLKYFNREDVARYEKLFEKHGRVAMFIMAVFPIPYLPTLGGVFKLTPLFMFTEVLAVRIVRHSAVFIFWYFLLV